MAEDEIRIADLTASSGLTNDDNFVVDKAGSNGTKKFSAADYIANKEELVAIRVDADGTTYPSAGDAVRAQCKQINVINGSWIKTKEIDYTPLTVSKQKKISGYDTITYDAILVNGNGSVVAQFNVSDVVKYGDIIVSRPTISAQWIILSKSTLAVNYTKSSTTSSQLVDLSNANYGVIHTEKIYAQGYSKIAIAFDGRVNISCSNYFDDFFKMMDIIKKNESSSKDVRNLYYSATIDIDHAQTGINVPFYIYNGEKMLFTNNTTGSIAISAFDANNEQTTISSGISSGQSVEFTASKDFIKLGYWSQQLGTLKVDRTNSILYQQEHDDENSIIASVNMFRSIAGIGDSYTAGSTKNSGGSWVDYRDLSWVATMGKRSGTEWKNYGHGGTTTKTYQETTEFASALSDTACGLYFFALGQNDANQGMTIGTVDDIHDSDYTQNPDTFFGNYGKIIQQIKTHAPNAKLVMVKNWVSGATFTPYDTAIEGIAEHYNIPVISPFDDFFFNSALYTSYMEYGHPTAMGYSSMGLAMERLFSKCVINNGAYFKFSTIG